MQAKIKKVKSGRNKGQFRFVLIANNGEPVADSHPESYKNKADLIDTLNKFFPSFDIIDLTKDHDNLEK